MCWCRWGGKRFFFWEDQNKLTVSKRAFPLFVPLMVERLERNLSMSGEVLFQQEPINLTCTPLYAMVRMAVSIRDQ